MYQPEIGLSIVGFRNGYAASSTDTNYDHGRPVWARLRRLNKTLLTQLPGCSVAESRNFYAANRLLSASGIPISQSGSYGCINPPQNLILTGL